MSLDNAEYQLNHSSFIVYKDGDELKPQIDYQKFLAKCKEADLSTAGIEALEEYFESIELPFINRKRHG